MIAAIVSQLCRFWWRVGQFGLSGNRSTDHHLEISAIYLWSSSGREDGPQLVPLLLSERDSFYSGKGEYAFQL
jgi:hypothetical protein